MNCSLLVFWGFKRVGGSGKMGIFQGKFSEICNSIYSKFDEIFDAFEKSHYGVKFDLKFFTKGLKTLQL
jgi:hypothetical protein